MSLKTGINRLIFCGGFILSTFFSQVSQAGVFELSGSFSYSQSNYGSSNFAWTRRWGVSFGYYFLSLSEIEFSVQDILYRTKMGNLEDTTFHDQIYSVDWVQSLTSKKSDFQPYFKLGVGRLNRKASGGTDETVAPSVIYNSLTVLAGAGIRVFLLQSFSLKLEGTTYLIGGSLPTARENFAFNGGVSFYF
jgi:hypothetical protein